MAKKTTAKSVAKKVEEKPIEKEVKEIIEPKGDVIPLSDVKVQDARILDKDDPAKANDIEQVSKENVEQEKIPSVPEVEEDALDSENVRFGEDGKIKDADKEENPGVSRFIDDLINPEFKEGRRSEWPRG